MSLTLDKIRSLKADKSYYISNATGEIKQAGFWHKFKMYFSVGDAEKKTEKLLHEVKIALLARDRQRRADGRHRQLRRQPQLVLLGLGPLAYRDCEPLRHRQRGQDRLG